MIAVVPAVVVGLALTAVALRYALLLRSIAQATPARAYNPHGVEERHELVGQRCEHCEVGIRPDGTDCLTCDATGLTLQPRDYLGRVWNSGGPAAATTPAGPPALTSGVAS